MHILHISAMLEDLLKTGHLYIVFLNQPSFHKLLMHTFMLGLDMLQYPALHDLLNSLENSENVLHVIPRKMKKKKTNCL